MQPSGGFLSRCDDYLDTPLGFTEPLTPYPEANFAVRVSDDNMTGADLFPGEIVVADRAVCP